MKKYISFIFTCGGDAGARFTNESEWQSAEGQLLFDSTKWDMESIHAAINSLDKKVGEREPWCHTFGDIMDNLFKYLTPFVDETKGVYINEGFIQSNRLPGWTANVKKSKRINPSTDNIESWCMNGSTRNGISSV